MNTKGQTAKKSKPDARTKKRKTRSQKKQITAGEAKILAARYVVARMFGGVAVEDGADVKWSVYTLTTALKDAWVVFPNGYPEETMRLGPSRVIVVSKRTGRVLYDGLSGED